jgi:hypothetical protein
MIGFSLGVTTCHIDGMRTRDVGWNGHATSRTDSGTLLDVEAAQKGFSSIADDTQWLYLGLLFADQKQGLNSPCPLWQDMV